MVGIHRGFHSYPPLVTSVHRRPDHASTPHSLTVFPLFIPSPHLCGDIACFHPSHSPCYLDICSCIPKLRPATAQTSVLLLLFYHSPADIRLAHIRSSPTPSVPRGGEHCYATAADVIYPIPIIHLPPTIEYHGPFWSLGYPLIHAMFVCRTLRTADHPPTVA